VGSAPERFVRLGGSTLKLEWPPWRINRDEIKRMLRSERYFCE
jgi:hypothetical protein